VLLSHESTKGALMQRLKSGRLLALLVLVLTILLAAGCGDDDNNGDGADTGSIKTIQSGTLTVGSDIPYKPFEFGRAPDYEGFDVDLVNEIANRLDLDPKFVKTPFDPIFRNLAQGRFDMVASAATITPERLKTVDFSEPYFPADQSLMVKKGSDIKTVDDVKGKTVGAQLGTTGADYAKKETDADTVRTYDLIDDAFKALQAGQVEAVINDFPVSKYAEQEKPELQVVQTIPTDEEYGFGFKKGNDALRQAVNEKLNELKEDGKYEEIYRKWFKADPPDRILQTGGT
jgi:polar amino acid transport system substrate-binding protein